MGGEIVSKKKNVITRIVIMFLLIMFFVFWYRDYFFNIVPIKMAISDCEPEQGLYDTYKEHVIASGEFNSKLDIIEFKEIRFNHIYEKLEQSSSSGDYSFRAKNEDDLFIAVYSENIEGGSLAEHHEIPHRIRGYIAATYGEDVLTDDYMFLKKAFKMTPDDLSFFGRTRNELVSNLMLFTMKLVELPRIYEYSRMFFELENVKGFQDGLASENSSVSLRVFDPTGRADVSYFILIIGSTTQEEIDVIINSIEFKDKTV